MVFIYILTGSVFKFTRGNLNRLLKNKNIESLPRTAKQLFAEIIVKSLRTDPKLRYETAETLISDVRELIGRINNEGVTHSSVWETSRKLCGEFKEDLFENKVLFGDKQILPKELPKAGSCVIWGEGGIGKTTLLKRLWYDKTRVYNPDEQAFFYVPLYRFDGKSGFIRRYIVSKLNFNEEVSTIEDGIKRLNDIMTGNKGGLYLLLDGYNEISGSTAEFVKEIREVRDFPRASVLVSTRKEIPEGREDFSVCRLMAFDSEVVKKSLNKRGLAYPDAEDLRELLKNPLMLNLYIKSRSIYKENVDYHEEFHTASDIIHGYVNSFYDAYKNISPTDKKGLIRLSYVLEILFPAFCAETLKKRLITYERAKKICKREYKRLKSRAFSRAFKKYSGKAGDILEGTKSFEEWFNLVLCGILINDTALITEDSGVCNIFHMNFAPCLGEDYKKIRHRYFKAAVGVRVPVCLVSVLMCSAVFSAGYYYTPGTHPIGRAETAANNTLMSLMQMETMYMTQMLTKENKVIDAMNSGGRVQALEVLYDTKELFENSEKYKIKAEPEDYLYFGLDSEAVEKYFQTAYDHCLWAADFYDRLEYALGEDSRYSDKQLEEAFENYEEYLFVLKKTEAYRLCQIEKSINKNSRTEIEKLKKTDLFLMEYSAETASLDGAELSALLDGNTGLVRKLEQIGLKLNFIRGAEI
ncbi:MAG: NACHT domain-containing protein [Clostridiales bacterium]|nr:NACHT domain-containing protein [Clostridiales bacterium]